MGRRLHRRMKNLTLIASLIFASALPATMPAAELPVRTVVLYKHGVGYFERSGALGPGESARLDFRAEEMNDVLKSLTINDQGGKVTGLRYDSSIPLDQKLTEFPFRINEGEPLSAVIDQLKGARIEMEFGPQKTAGAIVSSRLIAGDKDRPEREQLTLLMDSGELRNVDLAAATAIRFTDQKLQLQFKDYLAALTGARSKDKRSVYIDSTDSKSRDVRAAYIMPMPAWKSRITGCCSAMVRAADARRMGDCGQHHRRGLDERSNVAGVGQADFVHQPALCAEVYYPAGRANCRKIKPLRPRCTAAR